MSKVNNPRFSTRISEELKYITDNFLKDMGITQTDFLEKYLPVLFMGIDKDRYFELVEEVYSNDKIKELLSRLD